MILILGSDKDTHASHIACKLQEKKEDYIFLDTYEYPDNVLLNWYADSENVGCIKINGRKINFSDIKSVYWRNFNGIKYENINSDEEDSAFVSSMVYRERKSALYSLFSSLNTNWVNSMNAFELHQKKAYAAYILSQNGIRVPNTLITNDKDYVYDFFEKNNKNIICKPVLGGAYTEKITEKTLTNERLELLKKSPVQFQEFIDGVDIRVYAYKDNIYAVRIEAQTVDFREDAGAKLIPVELDESVKKDCMKVMKLLDLKYSGIDIRLNNKGEYVFIEANPAPMFMYAEQMTGYPLTEELLNLLLKNT